MLTRIWIVLHKETIDNLRDRRSVGSSFIWVLFNPVFFIVFLGVVNAILSDQVARTLTLPVQGAEYAPNLIAFLEQYDVVIAPAPANPEQAVRAGDVAVVLIISPNYGSEFQVGQPAQVQLVLDASNQGANIAIRRAQNLLQAYSRQIGTLRLVARGINPAVITALNVENIDVSTEQSRSANLLSVLPLVLLLSAFTGGLYLAIDATAGERERGSLEPLLLNPIPRRDLVLGKFAATFLFTLIVTTLTLIVFVSLLSQPAVQNFMGIKISFNGPAVVTMFVVLLPVIVFGVALQILVASFAKSFKEAQTYVSYLIFLPVLPGLFLSIIPLKVQLWMMAIPVMGQLFLILKIFRGEPTTLAEVLVATSVTTAVGLGIVWAAIRLYERERILFGRG